jgi:hypothetical protein
MQPAQYPMKNMVLTIARFVFPFTLDADKDRSMDMQAVMQDDWMIGISHRKQKYSRYEVDSPSKQLQ